MSLVVCGASVVLVGASLGWLRSGSTERNSFGVVSAARVLGLVDGPMSLAAPLWYLLPFAVGVLWLGASTGRRPLVALLGAAISFAALAAVSLAGSAPITVGVGPAVTAAGAFIALGGVTALELERRRNAA